MNIRDDGWIEVNGKWARSASDVAKLVAEHCAEIAFEYTWSRPDRRVHPAKLASDHIRREYGLPESK